MPDISKRLAKAQKHMEKGKFDDALEEYKLAFHEDPSNDSVVEIIADLYQRQNQPQRAVECYGYLFDKRVEQNNGPAVILMYRKMARLGSQNPARMLTCARFQEKQKPGEAGELYRSSAQKFLEDGQQAQALEALRRLAALDSGNPSAHIQLGEVAESLEEKEQAAQAFVRASELLGARDSDGRFKDQVVALLERAQALVPAEPRIALALANVFFESHNPDRAAQVLESLPPEAAPDRNRLLAEAYLAAEKFAQAEPLLWDLAPRLPEAYSHLLRMIESYLASGNGEAAFRLLHRLKQAMFSANKDEQFVGWVDDLQRKNPDNIELVEFLASLHEELNQGTRFSDTVARLFDLALNAGDYGKATGALERLAAAGSNPEENQARLERLRGNVDEQTYQALASRLRPTPAAAGAPESWMDAFGIAPAEGGAPAAAAGPADELILQAEVLLQFGQKDEATQYLRQIASQFPGEESRNEKLRSLFVEAGLAPAPPVTPSPQQAAPAVPAAGAGEAVVDMARVSAIVRNIYRQGTVHAVLSTGISEIGETWQVSRCVVGLCAPGKPPTTIQEYVAEGIPQSDRNSVAPLVASLVQLTLGGDPLAVEDVKAATDLSQIAPVIESLRISSLLALPLVEADRSSGVVVLEQCDRTHRWDSQQVVAVKTIVDQMAMAMSHVKLRSLMKAVADESSGLLNRSAYVDCLLSETARGQKQNTTLSVALLQFGKGLQTVRELGEGSVREYMQEAAQALAGHLRQNDIGVRYDITTLAMVLNNTNGKDALPVVDRIRKVMSHIRIGERKGLPVTVGVAEAVLRGGIEPDDSVTELINRVEAALETAHTEGASSKLLEPP